MVGIDAVEHHDDGLIEQVIQDPIFADRKSFLFFFVSFG